MNLWLDDVRHPPEDGGPWLWVKTVEDAIVILKFDEVEMVSFDHDLGTGQKDGYELAAWVEEEACTGRIKQFDWVVHSQNPVGRKRITDAMLRAEAFWMAL